MGIVGTEHYLVGIEDTPHHFYAERVIDEADPNLAAEVFAGQHLREAYWAIAGESAAVARALVPDIEPLDHAGHPDKARLGHHNLEPRMTVKDPREDKPGERFDKLNARRFFSEAGRCRDHEIRRASVCLIEPCFFHQDCEMKPDRYAGFVSERPERLPSLVVDRRVGARCQNVDMT